MWFGCHKNDVHDRDSDFLKCARRTSGCNLVCSSVDLQQRFRIKSITCITRPTDVSDGWRGRVCCWWGSCGGVVVADPTVVVVFRRTTKPMHGRSMDNSGTPRKRFVPRTCRISVHSSRPSLQGTQKRMPARCCHHRRVRSDRRCTWNRHSVRMSMLLAQWRSS